MKVDIAVVGGGAAGVDAAATARRHAPDASVALICPGDELLYRPWLIYLPARAVPAADMLIPLAHIAAEHQFQHVKGTVSAVDPAAGTLTLSGTDESVQYGQLILAAGAAADRGRIPGADQHALFPCDAAEARQLADRVGAWSGGTVAFVLTGERIGPGLEYAGWVSRAFRAGGRTDSRVVVVEDGDALERQFGERGADRIAKVAAATGVETIRGARIKQIEAGGIVQEGSTLDADLIAVTSPLRAPDLGLPADLLDYRRMLAVDRTLSVPTCRNIYAAGDFGWIRDVEPELPKTWMMARVLATVAAQNAAAGLAGGPTRELDMRKATRLAAISMPDIGGRTVFVRNRRPVIAGGWLLRLRYRVDAKYLAEYRDRPGVTGPARRLPELPGA